MDLNSEHSGTHSPLSQRSLPVFLTSLSLSISWLSCLTCLGVNLFQETILPKVYLKASDLTSIAAATVVSMLSTEALLKTRYETMCRDRSSGSSALKETTSLQVGGVSVLNTGN